MSFLDQRPSDTLLELQDIKKEMIEFFNFVAVKIEEIEKKQNADTQVCSKINGHLAAKIEELKKKQNANTDKK